MIAFVIWILALVVAIGWSVWTDSTTPIFVWLMFVIIVTVYGKFHYLLPWS